MCVCEHSSRKPLAINFCLERSLIFSRNSGVGKIKFPLPYNYINEGCATLPGKFTVTWKMSVKI